MRIDKFISNNSSWSRSEVKKFIKERRVEVNDELVESPEVKIKSKKDVVTLDGVCVEPIGELYIMLNKPKGYVCANTDSEHPTVMDLLQNETNFAGKKPLPLPMKDLQIAGRLDIDTTGLVFITTDGKWNHQITSPTVACKKVYRVKLERPLSPKVPEMFAKGMQLEGEKKKTRPAFLHVITPNKVRLALSEGKYHQVKRMFAATGNFVEKLHRESIAGVFLDDALEPGQYRFLTKEELKTIKENNSSDI